MAVVETDERYLVECHRAGDPDAFGQIFRLYYPGLLAHARRRLFDPQAAEDAVQETLLRAYRALPRFNGEYRLGGWLHRILVNVCIDESNRRRRQGDVVDRLSAVRSPDAAEPADLALVPTDGTALTDALDDLPAPYREALVLRFVEERTYEEISRAVEISEDNARARVSRAKAALRRVSTSGAAVLALVFGFLRRGQRAAAAAEITGGVGHDAPARLMATSSPVVAQLAPIAVDIGHSGGIVASGLVAGKVALAIGVAAAVAVPTANVAIERGSQAPAPAVTEVETPATGDDAVTVTAARSSPLGEADEAGGLATALGADGAGGAALTDLATADPAAGGPAAATTTPADAASPGAGDPDGAPGAPAGADAGARAGPEPSPALAGATITAEALTITPVGGDRLELTGALTIATARGDIEAAFAADTKVLVGEPDPEDPSRRSVQAVGLVLVADDGTTLTLTMVGWLRLLDGPAVEPVAGAPGAGDPAGAVTPAPPQGAFEFVETQFELGGAEDIGVFPAGAVTGRLVIDGSAGVLEIAFEGDAV